MDRQHYRPSVAAVHRKTTSVCTQPSRRSFTVDDNGRMELLQTSENPADAGTRGLSAQAPSESRWTKVPDFPGIEDWPFQPSTEIFS